MAGNVEHLRWCRWCALDANERHRRRHETKEHSFVKQATSQLSFTRSKSLIPPPGHIWCTVCNVIVQNSESAVSSHSKSVYHTSKSRKPLSVSAQTSPFVVSEPAAAPQPPHRSILSRSAAQDDKIEASKNDDHGKAFLLPSSSLSFFRKFNLVLIWILRCWLRSSE